MEQEASSQKSTCVFLIHEARRYTILADQPTKPRKCNLPLTIEHFLWQCLSYQMIITFKPLIFMLSNETGVVTTLYSPTMIYYSK